ncbi:MAG: hypothetical protein AABZ55_13585 [Bdellovibrionota bacterium]
MEYRDILAAHLTEDQRVKNEPASRLSIFSDPEYEVSILIYPGIPEQSSQSADLIAILVKYKEEGLRILAKLGSCEEGAVHDHKYIEKVVVPRLEAEGKGPLHFVRDVKKWCRIPLSERDQINLINAGLSIH